MDLQALLLAAAENETVQYFILDKASAAHLQDSFDSRNYFPLVSGSSTNLVFEKNIRVYI